MRFMNPEGEIWSALAIVAKSGIPVVMESFVRDMVDQWRHATGETVSMSVWADQRTVDDLLGEKGQYYNEAMDVLYKLSVEAIGRTAEMGAGNRIQEAFINTLTRFHVDQDGQDPLLIYQASTGEFMLERYSSNLKRIRSLQRG